MKQAIQTVVFQILFLAGALGAGAQGPLRDSEPISPDQLVLRYYTPQYLDDEELVKVAASLFGPTIWVATPDGSPYTPQRFLTLQDTVIVRDRAERADAILRELAEIENAIYPPEEHPETAPEQALESLEYAPRFLTTSAALDALRGYQRAIQLPTPDGGWVGFDNMSAFEERHMLLVRETPDRMAEIRRLLGTVDVPVPQASFTFLLIRGQAGEAPGKELPAELVQHLGRLLPAQSFELIATGLMRGSVRSPLSLRTGVGDHQYTLELEPAAFDPTSRELTLQRCAFQDTEEMPDGSWETGHEFETALSLRAGEYTVIGAVGSDPLFVVLRMEL